MEGSLLLKFGVLVLYFKKAGAAVVRIAASQWCLMVQITEKLLRGRAEHNDCCLSTLVEVSLHQQNLEGINR